jgi:hypothetical protein
MSIQEGNCVADVFICRPVGIGLNQILELGNKLNIHTHKATAISPMTHAPKVGAPVYLLCMNHT